MTTVANGDNMKTLGRMKMSKVITCKFCAASIRSGNSRREFCSDRCKWKYWAANHPRLAKSIEDLIPCVYCGLPATSIDHIPPQAERQRLTALNLIHRYELLEVNACRECNSCLGAKPYWTIKERKDYVKKYLGRKYKHYLSIPTWSDVELADLGNTLASSVLTSIIIADVIKERIRW